MSTFSFSLSAFDAVIFLLPIIWRRSSELLIFDDEDAPDSVPRFLLLLDIANVDDKDTLSLAIDSVEAPMFVDETSKLFADSLLMDDKFGDPARGFCEVITFSFSFRYDVIKS